MNDRREFTGGGVEEFFPYDGPHSRERVIDAAGGVSALVRYLNNATGYPATLRWASTIHYVLGGIEAAAWGLDQLLRQLAAALERQAEDPTLYDDRRRDDVVAAAVARTAADRIGQARKTTQALASQLESVRELTVHLGNEERAR